MDSDIIEMGSISSRGQIAIPSNIRAELGLEEGSKVVFTLKDNSVIMKKITAISWGELTKSLTTIPKTIPESDVSNLIHKLRKEKKL